MVHQPRELGAKGWGSPAEGSEYPSDPTAEHTRAGEGDTTILRQQECQEYQAGQDTLPGGDWGRERRNGDPERDLDLREAMGILTVQWLVCDKVTVIPILSHLLKYNLSTDVLTMLLKCWLFKAREEALYTN